MLFCLGCLDSNATIDQRTGCTSNERKLKGPEGTTRVVHRVAWRRSALARYDVATWPWRRLQCETTHTYVRLQSRWFLPTLNRLLKRKSMPFETR